jgi:hypothetical protein
MIMNSTDNDPRSMPEAASNRLVITDIVWDTDGKSVELPTTVEMQRPRRFKRNDRLTGHITKALEDRFDWLVVSYRLDGVTYCDEWVLWRHVARRVTEQADQGMTVDQMVEDLRRRFIVEARDPDQRVGLDDPWGLIISLMLQDRKLPEDYVGPPMPVAALATRPWMKYSIKVRE